MCSFCCLSFPLNSFRQCDFRALFGFVLLSFFINLSFHTTVSFFLYDKTKSVRVRFQGMLPFPSIIIYMITYLQFIMLGELNVCGIYLTLLFSMFSPSDSVLSLAAKTCITFS